MWNWGKRASTKVRCQGPAPFHSQFWGGGGTHIGRYYRDVPPSRPPFSAHFLAQEIHHFKPFSSSRDPTSIFQEILHFQAQFLLIWLNFSSWDSNFDKNSVRRFQFQAKKSVPETLLFENLGGTYLSKNFLSMPQPAGADPRMVRISTGPPFWQINHANSAYFRVFLGYFGVISATWPPFLDLGPPPPLYISWIRPWPVVLEKERPGNRHKQKI